MMFDELAERSLMSPLAGTKHTYVRLAIVKFSHIIYLASKVHFNFHNEKISFAYLIIMFRFAKVGHIKDSTAIPFRETFSVKVYFYLCEAFFKCQTAAICTISYH